MKDKLENLKDIISGMESLIVAYSGGVDSTFLLKVASQVLGEKVLAVTADSPSFPSREKEFAIQLARELKVKHLIVESDEMEEPNFVRNDRDRCYWCKKELFSKLLEIAEEEGLKFVAEASNLDDTSDHRPGLKAAQEMGIRSPLIEAELSKYEIRQLSKYLGLKTWQKPSMACLASRFAYGIEITSELLEKIEKAEELLKEEGFRQVRVRYHGDLVRIEVAQDEIARLASPRVRDKVLSRFKEFGFLYTTIDMEGYLSGSMNRLLNKGR